MTYFSLLFDRKLKEAESFRNKRIPSKLIKFISLGSLETDERTNDMKFKTLAEQKLWFSTTKLLNDPYEFQCMYVNRGKLKEHDYPDEAISLFEGMISKQNDNWALVSLSGNSFDSLPMWAYYTNNYQGFCVEYDVIKPDAVFEVGYEPNRIPTATIVANFYAEFKKMIKNKQITNEEVEFYATLLKQQFFLKHKSWEHENEYRIIYPISGADGLLVEIANVGLKTSKIVAGLNCSSEHRTRLNDISNALGCGDISVSKISGDKYTLLEDLRDE